MVKILLGSNKIEYVGKSSHPGHKSELEVRSKEYELRISFGSEDALDKFYKGVEKFYKERKKLYKK